MAGFDWTQLFLPYRQPSPRPRISMDMLRDIEEGIFSPRNPEINPATQRLFNFDKPLSWRDVIPPARMNRPTTVPVRPTPPSLPGMQRGPVTSIRIPDPYGLEEGVGSVVEGQGLSGGPSLPGMRPPVTTTQIPEAGAAEGVNWRLYDPKIARAATAAEEGETGLGLGRTLGTMYRAGVKPMFSTPTARFAGRGLKVLGKKAGTLTAGTALSRVAENIAPTEEYGLDIPFISYMPGTEGRSLIDLHKLITGHSADKDPNRRALFPDVPEKYNPWNLQALLGMQSGPETIAEIRARDQAKAGPGGVGNNIPKNSDFPENSDTMRAPDPFLDNLALSPLDQLSDEADRLRPLALSQGGTGRVQRAMGVAPTGPKLPSSAVTGRGGLRPKPKTLAQAFGSPYSLSARNATPEGLSPLEEIPGTAGPELPDISTPEETFPKVLASQIQVQGPKQRTAMQRYIDMLNAFPNEKPSVGRRIAAALAGVAQGYFGGPQQGFQTAQGITYAPQNRAIAEWQKKIDQLEPLARMESQEYLKQQDIDYKTRRDNLINASKNLEQSVKLYLGEKTALNAEQRNEITRSRDLMQNLIAQGRLDEAQRVNDALIEKYQAQAKAIPIQAGAAATSAAARATSAGAAVTRANQPKGSTATSKSTSAEELRLQRLDDNAEFQAMKEVQNEIKEADPKNFQSRLATDPELQRKVRERKAEILK